MANDLTSLIPSLIGTLSKTLKTRAGLLKAVDTSYDTKTAKVNDTIKVPRVTSNGIGSVTPSNVTPVLNSSVEEDVSLTLSNYKNAVFNLSGEEMTAMAENGQDYVNKKVQVHINALLDDIENSLWNTAYVGAGFAATSTNGLFSASDKLLGLGAAVTTLDQSGTPGEDRSFVFGATAQNALFGLNTPVVNVGEQGSDQTIRTGSFAPHFGCTMNFSKYGNKGFIASSAASWTVNGNKAAGTKVVSVTGGSGNFSAGDIVTIGKFKYVVGSWASNNLTLVSGLLEDVVSGSTVTVAPTSSRNVVLWRYSMIAAVRPPRVDGDAASEATIIVDPDTGVSMRLAKYPQYHTSSWELSVVHGNCINEPAGMCLVY